MDREITQLRERVTRLEQPRGTAAAAAPPNGAVASTLAQLQPHNAAAAQQQGVLQPGMLQQGVVPLPQQPRQRQQQ